MSRRQEVTGSYSCVQHGVCVCVIGQEATADARTSLHRDTARICELEHSRREGLGSRSSSAGNPWRRKEQP